MRLADLVAMYLSRVDVKDTDPVPDRVRQCPICPALFRESSMDKLQIMIREETGSIYCPVDAFLIWLEARWRAGMSMGGGG